VTPSELLREIDFYAKISWEGGISSALDYGLDTVHYDLPEDVFQAWHELVFLHGQMETYKDTVNYRMEEVLAESDTDVL
jgi:hypothetical protein